MDKTQKFLVLIFIMTGCLCANGQDFDDPRQRLKTGIDCYEKKRYMKAVIHFKEALVSNEKDSLAAEYLYWCYLELNKLPEALAVYEKLPATTMEKLQKSRPRLCFANVEEAYISGNQMDLFDTLDLDGEDNIYGETDITQDGFYFSAGLNWGFNSGHNVYGSYSMVKLNKNKMADIGDTISVDQLYPLRQHQFYLNGTIPVGNGFSVMPALNVVLDRYETVMPQLAPDSSSYLFPVDQFRHNSCIGYLSLNKDFNIVQASLFTAWSNLNEQKQFQAGFQAIVYPFGNLNFYLASKLLDHINDNQSQVIFEQMAGFRMTRKTWAELSGTFGKLQNYHENNALIVYNVLDGIKFKGNAKLIILLDSRWIITAEYLYLLREGEYISYELTDDQQVVPITYTRDFNNHIFLLGLKWKF